VGYENVGRIWTPESLAQYLATINKPEWCRAITLHHTGAPSLAQRPLGFTIQHIENIRDYYHNDKGWSGGPHLFIDDDQIFGMSDLRRYGVHAVSFNRTAIGIEVLGDYDREDPKSGRGLACWQTAAGAVRVLLDWLGLEATEKTVLFHRDDPLTTKSCPGTLVKKDWVLALVGRPIEVRSTETDRPDLGIPWNHWDYRGERWCVPLLDFLVAKGIPAATVYAKLKASQGKYYYGDELIEGAYYVGAGATLQPNERTWAPARELLELLA